MLAWKAAGSSMRVVTSQKRMPLCGKSGIPRMLSAICFLAAASHMATVEARRKARGRLGVRAGSAGTRALVLQIASRVDMQLTVDSTVSQR